MKARDTPAPPNLLHQRQASALQQLDLNWFVPLSDLQHKHQQSLQDASEKPVLYQSSTFKWQGVEFRLLLGLVTQEEMIHYVDDLDVNEEQLSESDVYAVYADIGVIDKAAAFFSTITVWKAPTLEQQQQPVPYLEWKCTMAKRLVDSRAYILSDSTWGAAHDPAANVEAVGLTWEQIEQCLRQRGLLFDDNCLHITAVVSSIV